MSEEGADNRVEFGLLLHAWQLFGKEGARDFEPLWAQAAEAEAAGFDHVWVGDSVTVAHFPRSDCLTTMAALAMATRTIGIGTVPLLLSLRNPVLVAHALATLDVIAKGRIRIGVSPGPNAEEIMAQFAACGVPAGEKAGRLSESVQLVRRLWAEERVDFEGKYYKFADTGILPKPVQGPTIPIWITADGNETALRRVARLGDGWVTSTADIAQFRRNRELIDTYAAEYGRAPGATAPSMLYATLYIDPDGEKAREDGWRWMEGMFSLPRERLARFMPIFGTPAECADQLAAYAEAGMTCLVARLAADDMARQTEFLMGEIKPLLARP